MFDIFKIIFYIFTLISSFFGNKGKQSSRSVPDSPGEPLLLTPFIEMNEIQEAQKRSKVTPDIGGRQSYSGYFTVNKACGSNLFFWLILSETNWEKAPVILWLNGGPGASSMFGLFEEIGPWNHKGKFIKNDFSWTKTNNVIFLDQPVGTGFSFTEKGCYPENMNVVAEEMYSALHQFFTMFPELQKNKFFMSGMSFAGHYIPETAMVIDKKNEEAEMKINLVGIVVGSPAIQYTCQYKGDLLYELGIVDEVGRGDMKTLDDMLVKSVTKKDYKQAVVVDYKVNMKLKEFDLPNYYNILEDESSTFEYTKFVTADSTRKQIHVGKTPYEVISAKVFGSLQEAYYGSQVPAVEYLLKKNYIVGFFNGQLDIICSYTSLFCVLKHLEWEGISEYLDAKRYPWYISNRLTGWFKVVGNLFTVLVRNAGHHVPSEQRTAMLTLINTVVSESEGTQILMKLKARK